MGCDHHVLSAADQQKRPMAVNKKYSLKMEFGMTMRFPDIYNEIARKHKSILPIDAQMIDDIDAKASEASISRAYYPATFTALFFFATAPAIFAYNFLKMQPQIEPFVKTITSYANSKSLTIHISLILVFIGTLIYTAILPNFDFLSPTKLVSKKVLLSIRKPFWVKKDLKFYVYVGILNYFNAYIAFAYLSAFFPQQKEVINSVVCIWVILPTLSLCILPTYALMMLYVMLEEVIEKPKGEHPYIIINELTRLLKAIDNASFGAWNSARLEISNKINEISYMILTQKYHYHSRGPGYLEISRKFSNSSFCFLNAKTLLYLQSSDSKRKISAIIIRMLNVFISGNMADLPDATIPNTESSRKRYPSVIKTISSLMLLGAFLSFPIAVWIATVHHFHLQVGSSEDALVRILYAVWSILGLVSFSEHLAPETKVLFFDIARGIAPKWKN